MLFVMHVKEVPRGFPGEVVLHRTQNTREEAYACLDGALHGGMGSLIGGGRAGCGSACLAFWCSMALHRAENRANGSLGVLGSR